LNAAKNIMITNQMLSEFQLTVFPLFSFNLKKVVGYV